MKEKLVLVVTIKSGMQELFISVTNEPWSILLPDNIGQTSIVYASNK
jgi:hypothetical protein